MCEFEKSLIAWIDGELEAGFALELDRHLEACGSCSAKVSQYRRVSRAFAAYHAALPVPKAHSRLRGPVGAAALAAAAATILWMLPRPMERLQLQPPKTAHPPVMAFDIRPREAAEPASVATEIRPPAAAAPRASSLSGPLKIARAIKSAPHQAAWQSQPAAAALVPFVEIAIPGDALFAPGAVPPGFTFAADLSIGGDGSPRVLRVQPGVYFK